MTWQEKYLDRYYRDREGWVNGTVEFHSLCRRHLPSRPRILEVGAGPANPTSEFLAGMAGSLTGLDVDEAVKKNPHLTAAVVYDGARFPFADASFDAAVSDYVLEHVKDPALFLREVHRVLADGGAFLFRTPNVFHYVSLLSRILPDRLSLWARNRRHDHPVYPKYFRFNSSGRCRRLLAEAGFDVAEMALIEKEPSYGMGSRLLFFPMMAYERIVNAAEALGFLRANILCCALKKGGRNHV